MAYMFYDCYSLKAVPLFDTSSVQYFLDMFDYCYSLETIPLFDTIAAEDMSLMFRYCNSLQKVPALNVAYCSNFSDIFNYCTALGSAPLKGAVNDISFYNCALSRNAIVAIFRGLGSASASIDVSYNFGANDLTAEDIAIAEGKGWSVSY
jgi:hypothetical protein